MVATRRKVAKAIDYIDEMAAIIKDRQAGDIGSHDLLAQEIEKDYFDLTSGTVKTRVLRRMGYPYAKKGTRGRQRGRLARLPINRQTGRLQKSIRLVHLTMKRDHEWRVGFDTRAAGPSKFVLMRGGTRRMVPRGIEQELNKRAKARHLAVKRVLAGRL